MLVPIWIRELDEGLIKTEEPTELPTDDALPQAESAQNEHFYVPLSCNNHCVIC